MNFAQTPILTRIARSFEPAQDQLRKYRRYRRTYAELNALPTDSLLDLELYRGDLKRIARDAAYTN